MNGDKTMLEDQTVTSEADLEGFALSPQQRHLWSLMVADGPQVYRVQAVVRIDGDVEVEALRAALDLVVARHEIFRTRFACLVGMTLPLQVVSEVGPAWEGEREVEGQVEDQLLEALFAELAAKAAGDPEQRPLRALLLRPRGAAEALLCLSLPALCADGASLNNLVGELANARQAVGSGSELADEPLQFADLAVWLNELLEADESAAQRQVWHSEELPPLLAERLPLEVASAAAFTPASISLTLHRDLLAGASEEPAAILLASWQLFLWHHLEGREVVVSVLSPGRDFEELVEALGPIARYLPIRCQPRSQDRFERLVRQASRGLQQAEAAGGSFSWEQLATANALAETLHPGFAFRLDHTPKAGVTVGGVQWTLVRCRTVEDRFSLQLACRVDGEQLQAALDYDGSRFERPAAERLARRFEALVERLAEHRDGALGSFEVLSDAERHQLLVVENRTAVDLGSEPCLHRLVQAQAVRTPGRIALRSGEESFTFAELAARAAGLAHRLRDLGAGPEERVALFAERSPQMVVGLWGILAAGATYVPLDPDHPSERLAAILADTTPCLLLVERRLSGLLPPEHRALVGSLIVLEDVGEASGVEAKEFPPVAVGGENLAYVIHTSGSTGRPKGVMVSHRAICNRLLWMQREFPLEASDRVLQKTPYSFDASIWEIFCPLLAGAELVLARPGGHADSAYLVEEVASSGITVLQLVPSLLHPFLEEPGVAQCTSLRRVFCGGEELPRALAERFSERFAAQLTNLYGPTETAIDATFWRCQPGTTGHGMPIGRALANVQVVVLNPRLHPTPPEVPGELMVGGVGLARGYQGRPAETAARFLPDPWSGLPGGRLYRTGDLVRRLPGGELEYLGRIDRQVKIRGARIELREIEAVLAAYPAMGQVVVAALPEAAPGEGARLAAYVVAQGGGAATALDLQAVRLHASRRLPSYMLPGSITVLRSLPRLPNGKVDVAALPLPEPAGGEGRGQGGLPRTPTEQLLVGAWAEVLAIDPPGIEDNFFDLGGHSLRATQLVTRLRQLFDVEVGVRDLFQRPTIAELAQHVDATRLETRGRRLPSLQAVPRDQPLPLSFAQQRLWFLEQLRTTAGVFNIPDAVRFRGPLEVAVLAAAIDELVRRHESLRTRFETVRGKAVQVISAAVPQVLPVIDLSALERPRAEAEGRRRIAELSWLPFDLSRGSLFRVVLLRLQSGEHLLSLTMHHIASDAWSMGVMLRELATLYGAFAAGQPSPLSRPAVQYADFASWQRGWLVGEVLESELDYWRRQLRGAPPLLELPADRPRPEMPSWRGRTLPVHLPLALHEALQALARRHGVTLFMTLLAVFKILLHHLTSRDDLVVGTDVANRNRAETEGVVGFFINQLALRSDLSGDPSFAELLARVREVTLEAYAHQDVPYDAVIDAVGGGRSLRHSALFQVKLFVENTPSAAFELPGLEIESVAIDIDLARLDLILAFWERPDGLTGWVNYNTDLFEQARIERILRQFEALAAAVTERPEAKLSELEETLATMEKKERVMKKHAMKDFGFGSFKAVQPKAVVLPLEEVVERTYLEPGQRLPLVLQPRVEDVDLVEWAATHVDSLEADLVEHGAVLFRGFGIDTPERLEGLASLLCPDLFNENSEHEAVTGNIYTPVFYPPDQQLLWHNENSFNHSWPRKIFFCCVTPAEEGGETPLVDSRRIYQALDPAIRQRFCDKGLIYQRNYAASLGLSWQRVFRTESPQDVEQRCRAARMEFDWRDGDRLRTLAHRPAVVRHPTTGDLSWFNQAQHWHDSCLDRETRESLLKLYADDDLPRQCRYGDGTAIADQDMAAILKLYAELEVAFRWQRGDVLMVDNILAAHGRNPFKGDRKILVALGQMTSFDQNGGAK